MAVTVTLKSLSSGFADQTLTVDDTSDALNYETLEKKLNIEDDDTVKAVVLNDDGAAVLLVPSSAKDANSFVVVTKTDAEIEGCNRKWMQANLDENAETLRLKYSNMGPKLLNSAMNGYMGDTHNQSDNILFPDYNANLRAAYSSGLHSQIPKEFTVKSSDGSHIGGAAFEPTVADVSAWKAELLRWAFTLGLENDDKRPKEFLPSVPELREAYKQGKEAVCISITEENWGKVPKDTFKLCSVPVAYAPYEGGQDKHLHDLREHRTALRKLYLIGVEDAWTARENNAVTSVSASDRVPDSPDLHSAFIAGANTTKNSAQNAPGCKTVLQDNFQIVLSGECDSAHRPTKLAFEQGLKEAWDSYSGAAAMKPDHKYADTGAPQRAAFKEGVHLRHAEEKRKEEEAKAAERDAAEEKDGEGGGCLSILKESYDDFKSACCPVFTKSADDKTLCCGTTLGDWLIILLIFCAYYFYLAMWMWAFLEILMTVAEPQRPW